MRILAVLALVAAACGDTTTTSAPDMATPGGVTLDPPPAGQGTQLKMAFTVGAGVEFERCQFFTLAAGTNINRQQVQYTPGSHHVLVYGTDYKSIPTVDQNGNKLQFDASQPFDCSDGATALFTVTSILGGSQNDTDKDVNVLPPGVAIKIPAGGVVLLNAHYINATTQALDAEVRINLFTIPDSAVTTEAGIIFFYNPFIDIGPMSTSSARMSCPITKDITLLNAQSHMHKRGVNYLANLVDKTDTTLEMLYANKSWGNVPIEQYSGGKMLKAGTSIDFHCDYASSENRTIIQGPTTKDEMCMFIGAYYPRDTNLENCSAPGYDQDSAATWYGVGKATCGDTVTCVQASKDAASYYSCIVNSCTSQGPLVSNLLHCIGRAQAAGGPCASCQGAACTTCLESACGSDLGACLGAPACN